MVKSQSTPESRFQTVKSGQGCEACSVHPRILNTVILESKGFVDVERRHKCVETTFKFP